MTKSDPKIRAVILAAGQGKRMKSNTPKVLHQVLGKSILERVIDSVNATQVEKIHIVLGHSHEKIESYLDENKPAVDFKTHLQEPQLGTGHALMQVQDDLNGFEGNLIVTVGDAPLLKGETLKALVETHNKDGATVTILSAVVDDAKSYGRIVRDKDGSVKSVVEAKDATSEEIKIKEINSAIYCFKWPEVEAGLKSLTNDNNQKEYYLTDLVAWPVNKGLKVSAVVAPDWWEVSGVNSRVDLADVVESLRNYTNEKLALESGVTIVDPKSTWIAPEVVIGRDSIIYPGCFIEGNVKIGECAKVGPGTTIRGNVGIGDNAEVIHSIVLNSEIGSNCRIGPYAHVREGNHLADKVRVGNFVELKKANVGSNTNVSHLSYVGDATLGAGVNIGAGTITANYDHITKIKEHTSIGDGASTGSNSVLVAPVSLGRDAVVGAGTVNQTPDHSLFEGRASMA